MTKLLYKERDVQLLVKAGRQIFPNQHRYRLPGLEIRMDDDTDGLWMEVGFRAPEELVGSAATGWVDSRALVRLDLETSVDLVTWELANMVDCATTAIDNGDGTWDYWSRAVVPHHWASTMVDLTMTNNRYGKSIVAIDVMGSSLSLPHYPYAMPGDAAQLQTDLRAAGYTGATVTSSSAAITAAATNHTVAGAGRIGVTMSGSAVTGTAWHGSTISLPSYPYSMPSQQAALQADLRTAGYTGAVVMLFGDPWTIYLPDRLASGVVRDFTTQISPGDPFPYWDFYGNYIGLNPADGTTGTPGNVRTPSGSPLDEAEKQFVRLKATKL